MFTLFFCYAAIAAMISNRMLDELLIRSQNPDYEILHKDPQLIVPCLAVGWLLMPVIAGILVATMIKNKVDLNHAYGIAALEIFGPE